MDESERTLAEKPKQSMKYVALVVIMLVVLAVAWFVLARRAQSEVPAEVQSAKTSASFPLYYPQPLPNGFSSTSSTLNVTDGAVMFNVKDGKGNVIIITEQPLPRLTEEVTKTKQFSTPAGPAFLAQLNGRTVGFVHTEKTLIIVSPTSDVGDDQLTKLLSNLQKI